MVDDGRTTDGRTPDHGHPISSPCEPDGSGELMSRLMRKQSAYVKNKDADQLRGNHEADLRLCFHYTDSTVPLLLKNRNFKLLACL